MNSKVKIIGSGLAALALLQSGLAQDQLPTFKAPLKKTESGREYTGSMKFDPQQLTFHCGSKKVLIQQDGTICIYAGNRMLGKAMLFISTPFKMYQYASGIKKFSGKYDGNGMQVREIRTPPIPW